MGSSIKLTAGDEHRLDAYVAEGGVRAAAAIVVIQEIFGVNGHIRSVADDFACQGFWAIAPALFDRVQPNVELAYDSADSARGMQIATKVGMDAALSDLAASLAYAGAGWSGKKVGVVGYCFGGTLAWLTATRLHPSAAICYYGGRISQYAAEIPRCPVTK